MHMSPITGRPRPSERPRNSTSDGCESFGSASRMSSVTKGCSRSRAVDSLEGGASTPEATGAGASSEVVPKHNEHDAEIAEARAPADTPRERETRLAAQKYVEAIVFHFGVFADRRPARKRAGLRPALKPKRALVASSNAGRLARSLCCVKIAVEA